MNSKTIVSAVALTVLLPGTLSFASNSELKELKAQIESLTTRIAEIETSQDVPAGYNLLTTSQQDAIIVPSLDSNYDHKYYSKKAATISIVPTADAPDTTKIQWSGFARAALVYWKGDVDKTNTAIGPDKSIEIYGRGEARVVGTTDTAVGEVGARIVLRADFEGFRNTGFGNTNNGGGNKGDVLMSEAWGWWKLAPDMTLGGGYTGSLARINFGVDGSCICYVTNTAPVRLNTGDRTQMRLSYASGPVSFAIALEDADFKDPSLGGAVKTDTLGTSAELKWKSDSFSAELSGGYWDGGNDRRDAYQIGLGAKLNIAEGSSLSAAAGMGRASTLNTSPENDYWRASLLGSFELSDVWTAELGYGYAQNDVSSFSQFAYSGTTGSHYDAKVHSVMAGIYYEPVSQLTLGLESEWQSWNSDANVAGTLNKDLEVVSVGLVSVYRF